VRTCRAASKLVERWTLNGVFLLRPISSRCRSPFHLTFLFSGDIEVTPRPSNFALCTRGILPTCYIQLTPLPYLDLLIQASCLNILSVSMKPGQNLLTFIEFA